MLSAALAPSQLEAIPVLDTGPSFAMETLVAHEARAHALLDLATGPLPSAALRQLDKVSRRWLAKWENAHLAEIDAIAARLALAIDLAYVGIGAAGGAAVTAAAHTPQREPVATVCAADSASPSHPATPRDTVAR